MKRCSRKLARCLPRSSQVGGTLCASPPAQNYSTNVSKSEDAALREAVGVLRRGGVVAHATEGVWGLACDPFDEAAVAKVLRIKGRPMDKGLIVIAGSAKEFAAELVALPRARAAAVRETWPGAVSWVTASSRFPGWITGGRPSVAIRVPGHAQARALAAAFGGPLVSTSANRGGGVPARTAAEVAAELGADVDYLLAGETAGRTTPSTIRDAATGAVLR